MRVYTSYDLLLTSMCVLLKACGVIISDCNNDMFDCDDDKDRDDSRLALGILLTYVPAHRMFNC